CAGAGAVLFRAWDLQVRRAPLLKEMAEEQYLRDVSLSPKRGTIYDRDGAELAVSVDVDSVWANPLALRKSGGDPRAIATQLAGLLGVDAEIVTQRLSSDRHFVWIKRRVTPSQGKAIAGLKLPGISMSGEARRFYPNRELAAHVLGFANVDGAGIEGVELALEDKLKGPAQAVPALLDRRGEVVFSERLLDDGAALGDDITLTLDKTLQHLAERELELAVHTSEARAGSLVMLDPSTGEIYAMANYPTFNPNEPTKASGSDRRNRAITDRFEPGSTIKPFTLSGALAMQAINPSQILDCENGSLRVAEYTIHDSHHWQLLSIPQILAVSSNIGTAKVGLAMGRAGLYRSLTRFGFGSSTGIGLPGETSGILRHYKRWYDMDAATIAFGQGMSTTTLQLATALGAIANKGRLLQPTLVRRVTDSRGAVLSQAAPQLRRQVIPESVARTMTEMMIGVTAPGGTGVEAALDGYLVAGKTGTAQKADYVHGGYSDDKWTSSFIGFAPAQKPRLVVAVVIDEPMIAHQGGTVAAPVFRRVMSAALRHLGVSQEATGTLASLPAVAKADAAKTTDAAAKVVDATLTANGAAAGDAPAAEPVVREGELLVPNLVGRPARAAVTMARAADFDVRLSGSGFVSSQLPAAGAVVTRGTVLQLQLTPPAEVAPPVPPSAASLQPAPAGGASQMVAQAPKGGRDG
ncbi:MAG TPA: penicillin-binding protein, partial [Polyangiales bacterium]|nr:penicillin-binding protein [Polyangiales bacterium]